jgi:DNA-directed RNA polymerase specialized sigma24 family protein
MDRDILENKLRDLHAASFAWALACCGYERQEAEDVLQTVYLKIIDGRARFDGLSSLKTWLFSVIRWTAHERRRSTVREMLGLQEFRSLSRVGVGASPPAFSDLREALASLPARQREALELVFYQDMSIEEAASVMHVSVGTARTHYERGKLALRTKLKAQVKDDA